MSNKTFSATHVQNLSSLVSYIKSIDSSLDQLSQTIGADLKNLDSSLTKGTPTPRKYLPRVKRQESFQQVLYKSLLTGSAAGYGDDGSASSQYRTSGNQLWAQLASGISKAIGKSL